MKKFLNILYSTRTMSIVIVLFAVAMAVATFVENDYGIPTAQALVYRAWWFEILMLLLAVNLIGNVFKYKLYKKKKWPVFLFHIAFIITLLGSFVTRYFGYEGMMPIREGAVSNTILSEKTYIDVIVDNGKEQFQDPISKEVLFGALSNNRFKINKKFRDKEFRIQTTKFINNAMLAFKEDDTATEHLHLVISSNEGRKDLYLAKGESSMYANSVFTYNKPIEGGMNFVATDNGLNFQSAQDGTFMEMQSRKKSPVFKDSISTLKFKHLYSYQNLGFVISDAPKRGKLEYVMAPKNKINQHPYDAVFLEITSGEEKEEVVVFGRKNAISNPLITQVNGLNYRISYGSKEIKTPFSIKLRDFQLDRYPGSNSPSSYASEITVMDTDSIFDYRIFMNHVLDYKGYRFFQSNYDPDEKGTVLSVNHDFWGTLITYIGYILMALGMFFSLFIKGSRFKALSDKLNKSSKSKTLLFLILFGLSGNIWSQDKDSIQDYTVDKTHADQFGRLLIQDHQGRIKPINTYALDVLRKVYKKDKYKGLTAEQVVLSSQVFPQYWNAQKILKVGKTELGSKIIKDINAVDDYTSMSDLLKGGQYYFSESINKIYNKKDTEKNSTDKEILKLDEKANIWWALVNGQLLKIYPKRDDNNNTWFTGTDRKAFIEKDTMLLKMHQMYLSSLRKAVKTGNYNDSNEFLEHISNFQKTIGAEVVPSKERIDFEILYNRLHIFFKLLIFYSIVGFVLFLLAFIDLFQVFSSTIIQSLIKSTLRIFTGLAILGFLVHGAAMGVRWYVSDHAPWSNSYETTLLIALVSIMAGIVFSINKSKLIIGIAVLFATLLLGLAHGSSVNPEMTNMVPVLKSYWLIIHVVVITSGYGFLGLGSLLGFIVLFLYIFRNKNNAKRINATINELTIINELTLTVGLFGLTIGNFLGGVWANESWGRYWGWDPKEVWALISIMVYVFVLHMRLVPGLKGKFSFNTASMFSIATLIMTYYGVNFYLSGMHSYATGDPVPIQPWMYFALVGFVVFAIVSYWRYKSFRKIN